MNGYGVQQGVPRHGRISDELLVLGHSVALGSDEAFKSNMKSKVVEGDFLIQLKLI